MEITREKLYEMVWPDPMRVLAARHGVSDRGLSLAACDTDPGASDVHRTVRPAADVGTLYADLATRLGGPPRAWSSA